MPRTTINRSVSFDPEIFERMESRRESLYMDRSEYIVKCVLKDLAQQGLGMLLAEKPASMHKVSPHASRTGPRKARRNKH